MVGTYEGDKCFWWGWVGWFRLGKRSVAREGLAFFPAQKMPIYLISYFHIKMILFKKKSFSGKGKGKML